MAGQALAQINPVPRFDHSHPLFPLLCSKFDQKFAFSNSTPVMQQQSGGLQIHPQTFILKAFFPKSRLTHS